MNCTRNCLYQGNGECGLKLTSSDATSRCPLVPEDSPADAPFKYQPTRADHIRSMTDEELAVVICQTQDQCSCCELTETDGSCTETLCVNAMIRWLKQPYKEAEDG